LLIFAWFLPGHTYELSCHCDSTNKMAQLKWSGFLVTPNVAHWVSPKSTHPNIPNIIGHLTEHDSGYLFDLFFHNDWDGCSESFCGWAQLFNATNGTASFGQALTNPIPCTEANPSPPFSDPLPWQISTGVVGLIAFSAICFAISSHKKSTEATPLTTNSSYQYQ
jgi:hypothetical protein